MFPFLDSIIQDLVRENCIGACASSEMFFEFPAVIITGTLRNMHKYERHVWKGEKYFFSFSKHGARTKEINMAENRLFTF